jgi:zinc transport system ATP-binding protein
VSSSALPARTVAARPPFSASRSGSNAQHEAQRSSSARKLTLSAGARGYVAQRAVVEIEAPATVRELVAAGRVPRRGLGRRFTPDDRVAVATAIERVGLAESADSPVQRLSGGQQQRASIAKALAGEPDLLVLDEPTAGVDADAQESFAALLGELHRELGVTIVYVSHEFGAVEPFVQRLVLVRGQILYDGPPSELPDPWHDPSHVHR